MKIKVQFKRRVEEAVPTPFRVPRIAKLMALAIHFDQLIRDGKLRDQAEIAELGRVSRVRVTQIMNLLNQAPEIQEELLFGSSRYSERAMRKLTAISRWAAQRDLLNASIQSER